MYIERFSPNAIQVIQLLKAETTEAEVPVVPGTGHLVQALMEYRSGFGASILDKLGLGYSKMRDVKKLVQDSAKPGNIHDPHIKARVTELEDVFRMSAIYADFLHSPEVDTEHLLMGIFCDIAGADDRRVLMVIPEIDRSGAAIIRQFGVDAWRIDQAARKLTRPVKRLLSPY